MENTKHHKPHKRKIYTAMMVLVEMEVHGAQTQEQADGILRHKMQTLAATNSDIAVSKLTPKGFGLGFDHEPLP